MRGTEFFDKNGAGRKCGRPDLSALSRVGQRILDLERKVGNWMSRRRTLCLRISLGLVFLLFGAPKLIHGFSPAELLAGETLMRMSFGWLNPAFSVPALGVWECLIGFGLVAGSAEELSRAGNSFRELLFRLTLPALFLHLAGTALPLVLMPGDFFGARPGEALLTLECQYILKNVVLVGAAISLGGRTELVKR